MFSGIYLTRLDTVVAQLNSFDKQVSSFRNTYQPHTHTHTRTHAHTHTHTYIHTDKHTDKHTDTETETDRQTDRQTDCTALHTV